MTEMGFLIAAAKVLIVVVLTAAAAVYFFQHRLVFYPAHLEKNHKFNFSVPFEEKFINYDNGKTVHGILFQPEKPKLRILYFHGNAGAVDSWGELGEELAQKLNAEVLMMDYPGYGKSDRNLAFSEKGLYDSGQAALEEINKTKNAALPLIVYGRSLGTGVASYLAATNKMSGLILETPYLSTKAMGEAMFPWVPFFMLRYHMDNTENLKRVKVPVLILHGTEDFVVPYSHGKKLAELNPKVNFVTIQNGGHNDLPAFPEYWKSVQVFISSLH